MLKNIVKSFKRTFNLDHVEWVENTDKKHPTLEAGYYLLVKNKGEGEMLFTPYQVKTAKERAKKQPEDLMN